MHRMSMCMCVWPRQLYITWPIKKKLNNNDHLTACNVMLTRRSEEAIAIYMSVCLDISH